MRPVHRFRVEPELPASLGALRRLANNLHWTWDRGLKDLFARLDPQAWEASGHDPVHALEMISLERWAALAADTDVVEAVAAANARLDEAVAGERWFQQRSESPLGLVAYFSPEFGLSETLPQYSGGLGILAGDHLKAASDLGVPLVALGLLYAEGYFRQRLDPSGWQVERFPRLDPAGLPITDTGIMVPLDLAGEPLQVRVWKVEVGRVPLYLMDTDVEGNSDGTRAVTDRLYGGDTEHRLRQEIVLGIGGVRALRALGLHPQVMHSNEGHAGFAALERIRELVVQGLAFGEAVEAVRAGGVFTTHTPVPAGIDRFPEEMISRYFGAFAQGLGIGIEELLAIGRRTDDHDTRFNMAVMGLRLNARSNGVAQLHGAVSREMFHGLWPEVTRDDVPIVAITNGVHARTWVSAEVEHLMREYVHPVWDGADEATWAAAANIPAAEVHRVRAAGRAELVNFVRQRMGDDVLDPEALTIGFARRFATYKRATLLLSHPDRLRALLEATDRPVQMVFAGKAHPADQPGKEMIQAIEQFARQLDIRQRFVFLPDYDMQIARAMYHGCDVWLNNPRRPLEACGTSGMKAALNGCLNLSVLDGWWDECFDGANGWAIPSADDDPDLARRDEREALALFSILENEVVPSFYERDAHGCSPSWCDRIRHGWVTLGPYVTASRMVRDYVTRLYEPAAAADRRLSADGAAGAKALAAWKQRVAMSWPQVRLVEVASPPSSGLRAGSEVETSCRVYLDGLDATDVVVEVVHGRLDTEGDIIGTPEVVRLSLRDMSGDRVAAFAGRYRVHTAGPHGIALRVRAEHPEMASPFELGRVLWA